MYLNVRQKGQNIMTQYICPSIKINIRMFNLTTLFLEFYSILWKLIRKYAITDEINFLYIGCKGRSFFLLRI